MVLLMHQEEVVALVVEVVRLHLASVAVVAHPYLASAVVEEQRKTAKAVVAAHCCPVLELAKMELSPCSREGEEAP